MGIGSKGYKDVIPERRKQFMPASFDKCVKNGGKVRTISGPNKEHGLKTGEYVHYCTLNGKSYRGYVKKKKSKKKMVTKVSMR